MRPEFRAWAEEGKAMYYDVYPFKDGTLLLSYDGFAFDEVPASDFILMQSTGLKDKNGKKIFEGDIVKKFWFGKMCIYQIDYDNGLASFIGRAGMKFTTFDYDSEEFEVVGNIHDIPELLGGNNNVE